MADPDDATLAAYESRVQEYLRGSPWPAQVAPMPSNNGVIETSEDRESPDIDLSSLAEKLL